MATDHVGKDVAGGDQRSMVNGQDLEQPRGDQEPAADHVSRGLSIAHFVRELMVEGVASFVLVFWSSVAALMQEMHGTLSFPMVCLVVALTVGFVLCWLGPAHFNPAVTATFAAFGYLPWPKVPFYVAVQLAGSVLACLAVNGVMRPREEHFYGTAPMAGHTDRLPFLLELLASAVLMIVIATAARGPVRSPIPHPQMHVFIVLVYMLMRVTIFAEPDGGRAGDRRRRRDIGPRHRAGVGRVDEPDQDAGPGHRAGPVHLRLDLPRRARRRHAHRRALQPRRQELRRRPRIPLRRRGESGGAQRSRQEEGAGARGARRRSSRVAAALDSRF
ncbi:unnamed protein product [Urochloa decumbens]|uniref:Uncharacterized protein n=1 Tax=Urochloa decumbens TaxID=240449 RepID=A0ABC8ZN35_9POAL